MEKAKFFLLTKSLGFYINLLSLLSPDKAKSLSYRLFSEPRYGKLAPTALPDILQNADKETLFHDGDAIQTYSWKGKKPVILLVHGWESNAARWELLLPYLLDSKSAVVALDAPNHGLSGGKFSIPKYAEFIKVVAEKWQPEYVIGHSLGGAASVYYQHLYQNPAISKMVLMGAPADFNTITQNYVRLLSLSKRSNTLFDSHFTQHFNFHPDDFTARRFAKNLSVKGIIVHDADDDVVLLREGKKIAEAWKHAEFIETKGLGHSMHDADLYRKIAAFLFGESLQ